MKLLNQDKWIRAVKLLTNGLMGYTILIFGITMYQRYDAWRIGGACPVPLQRIWTYSAIASALAALVLILVVEKWQKQQVEQLKENQ